MSLQLTVRVRGSSRPIDSGIPRMNFYSTRNNKETVNFREAVIKGIAADGGLYVPATYPQLATSFIETLSRRSISEIGFMVTRQYCNDISDHDLQTILEKTLTFDFPLLHLSATLSVLELFHGPTLAFKDLGARFLANLLAHYLQQRDKEIMVLVATSGDTGSAVAHGFYGMEGIKVSLLYPSKKVSRIQEQQLTTLDKNIHALEIDGTFDDCQSLVKQAFHDPELQRKYYLTSANSINIARLLPQSFYYFYSFAQLPHRSNNVIVAVPSGNFGNLTAGLIAAAMGLPVRKFIAAVNSNTVFPDYLSSGTYEPRPAVQTLSNAMDVGDPSNVQRILSLFKKDLSFTRKNIYSCSISDEETVAGIREVFQRYRYIIDPHGAVGYQAIKKYQAVCPDEPENPNLHFITLETAHPAKFTEIVSRALNMEIEMPPRLAEAMHKQKKSIFTPNDFTEVKSRLLDLS
jgi:threonine synthase